MKIGTLYFAVPFFVASFFFSPKDERIEVLLIMLIFFVWYGFNDVIKILNEIKSGIQELKNHR